MQHDERGVEQIQLAAAHSGMTNATTTGSSHMCIRTVGFPLAFPVGLPTSTMSQTYLPYSPALTGSQNLQILH